MKKATFKFQSRDFDFPETLYIGCIDIVDRNNKKQPIFLTRAFDNLEILKQYVLFVIDDLSQSSLGVSPIYKGTYIKCNISHLFPLNKLHWGGKLAIGIDALQKFRNDVNIIKYWKISEVMVTPDGEIGGMEFFSFCVSLFKGTQKADIDLYIKNSSHVVDVRAKNAAFYSLNKPVKVNWLAGRKNNYEVKIIEDYIN